MGLFDKFKKKEKVLQQDTSQIAEHPGMVFIAHLLMDEMCDMPEKECMTTAYDYKLYQNRETYYG